MLMGLRYPLKMLPALFFELAWKTIWLLFFALPLLMAHQVDPDTWDTIKACALVWVIFPFTIQGRHDYCTPRLSAPRGSMRVIGPCLREHGT